MSEVIRLNPPTQPRLMKSAEFKSLDIAIAGPSQESTIDGESIAWPLEPNGLALLFHSVTEHQRCCHAKAEGSFGNGMSNGDAVEALMEKGSSATSFAVSLGLDLEAYGNAFVERVRAGNRLVGLRRLPARTMYRGVTGGFVQWIYEIDGQITRTSFTEREVYHLKEPCVAGLHYSMPTWSGSHNMMELVYAAIKFNESFFRNRAIPDYAVIVKGGALEENAKARLKAFFQENYMGPENAHRAIYIPAGANEIEFQKLTADMKDGDFLKLIDTGRDRVLLAHGVPPRMLGVMAAGALGGGGEVEGQMAIFEALVLKPRRRRMAEHFMAMAETESPVEFAPMDPMNQEDDEDQASDPDPEAMATEQTTLMLAKELMDGH